MLAAIVLVEGDGRDAIEQVEAAAREAQVETIVELGSGDFDATASNFELFGIPFPVLAKAASLNADAVYVLDGTQTAITAKHLEALADDLEAEPDKQVVTSWITWLRRTPYLIRGSFLDELVISALANPAEQLPDTPSAPRPIPHFRVRDHVFGEEPLAAPPRTPESVTKFLSDCHICARQAVQLARWANQHPGERLVSPNVELSLMAPPVEKDLTPAERELVDIATEIIGKLEDSLTPQERSDLEWADDFGKRNRRDFPIFADRAHRGKLAYLDSAATSQRLGAALDAQRDFDLHENANVYRGAYQLSAQATFTLNDARKRLEDFIGAQRRETVYTANTTAACNLVAQAWGEHNVGAGDRIIVTIAEHHSNMLPFALLAERKGAAVEYLPLDDDGRIDQDAYRAALSQKPAPKLVCVAHVGNVLGLTAPVREMAKAAHQTGARFLLDAAQSLPHLGFKVRDLGCDFVAFSAHKAYGPMGIGGLWIAPDAFQETHPVASGGGAVSHVSTDSYYLRPKSLQFEPGTPAVSQAIGFAAAIDYLDALGMDQVERHGRILTDFAARGLSRIEGVTVLGDHSQPDGQCGLVSFSVRNVAPSPLAAFLGSLDVAIRSGGHCALPLHASLGLIGSGRISLGVYTIREEIEAALVAIEACRRAYEGTGKWC